MGGSHAEMKRDKVMCSFTRAYTTAHVLGLILTCICRQNILFAALAWWDTMVFIKANEHAHNTNVHVMV